MQSEFEKFQELERRHCPEFYVETCGDNRYQMTLGDCIEFCKVEKGRPLHFELEVIGRQSIIFRLYREGENPFAVVVSSNPILEQQRNGHEQ